MLCRVGIFRTLVNQHFKTFISFKPDFYILFPSSLSSHPSAHSSDPLSVCVCVSCCNINHLLIHLVALLPNIPLTSPAAPFTHFSTCCFHVYPLLHLLPHLFQLPVSTLAPGGEDARPGPENHAYLYCLRWTEEDRIIFIGLNR